MKTISSRDLFFMNRLNYLLMLALTFGLGRSTILADELNLGAMVQPVPADCKFSEPGNFVWCGAPVRGTDGKYHLFYSRWPVKDGFHPGWAIHSEIAYAVSDQPLGPYKFVNVALPARGTNTATGTKFWDADVTHNPNIILRNGKFLLYYVGNYGDGNYPTHRNHQRIGVAVADKPEGPWRRFDAPIIDVNTDATAFDSLCVANPAAAVRPDGGLIVIYKAVPIVPGKEMGGNVRYGVAVADKPEGPYVKKTGHVFEAEGVEAKKHWMLAEDPYIWFSKKYGNHYYAVARDVVGQFTGASGGLALFESADGFHWQAAAHSKVLGARFNCADGTTSNQNVERPALLLDGEEPVALFGATDGYMKGGLISYNVQIPLQPLPTSTPRPPIVILPLGDSITLGASHPGGYRAPLLTLLTNAGYQIQFVGSDTNNPTAALTAVGNKSHEGHGSYTTSNLLANLDAVAAGPSANNGGFWLTGISGTRAPVYPDVILLMAGVNDLGVNQLSATHGLAGLDALINKLAALRPAAQIIVSTLTPYIGTVYPNREAHQQEFNAALPALVAAHQAAGQRVTLCDVRTRVNLANAATLLCSDGVHPNQAGYNEIALVWFDAIRQLPASTPPVVTWTSPSTNALGSMPLGNGDITLNAWVESSGDLLFYIGKSDSWEDNSRLAKLGKVRVKLNPPLAPSASAFTQTLNPLRGEMTVTVTPTNSGATSLKVWADANNPVVHVQIKAPSNVTATASFELWRTNSAALSSIEASDINYDTSQPNNMHAPTVVEPDTVLTNITDGVGWYHRNNKSLGPNETMGFQDLLAAPTFVDPILGRTFGCLLRGPSFVRADNQTIVSSNATSHRFDIYALTKFPATSNEWLTAIRTVVANTETIPFTNRYDAHIAWWSEFWDRSYIEITARTNAADPAAATDVATAYALQRFVTACAGRGNYPIKFNGSSFAMPWSGKPGDADYRRWGGGYWWQNTRLPYAGLCTSGDYDMMPSLFRMYLDDVLPVARYRAGYYYADPRFDDSCFMSEVTYPWGAVFSTTYGWTTPAASRAPEDGKLQTGQYHKREWGGGLELSFMLLDYYDHTGDTNYLTQKILPATLPLVRWFDRYYTNIVGGKLVMNPSQALETWWICTNAMPEVAGLQAVVARLLALPTNLVSASDRVFLTNLQAKIPPLPTRVVGSTTMLAPAQSYASKNNIELPEQYAVYPFRLVSFEKTNAAWGVAAYDAAGSGDKGANGWRQDDIFMAYLGLADRAKTNVISRARNKDAACRFPAFFGPNFDWTPDQCHGGVLMKAVQAMLLQSEGDKIFLLPAWPKDWDVKFKLHAPKQTTVEASLKKGKLVSLHVDPKSRRKDVMIPEEFKN